MRKAFSKMDVTQIFRKLSVVKHYSLPVNIPTYWFFQTNPHSAVAEEAEEKSASTEI